MDAVTFHVNTWNSLCTRYLRMCRYEARLIKEGFVCAREQQLGVVLPRNPRTGVYNPAALIELAKPRLPSLYRRTKTLRSQLNYDLDALLAPQDPSTDLHRPWRGS